MSDNRITNPALKELIESIKQDFKELENRIELYRRQNMPISAFTFLFDKLNDYRERIPSYYLKYFNMHYNDYLSEYEKISKQKIIQRLKNEGAPIQSLLPEEKPKNNSLSHLHSENFGYSSQESSRFHRESKFDPFRLKRLKRI